MIKKFTKIILPMILLFSAVFMKAQNCGAGSLYLMNAQNGNVYNIFALNGNLPGATTNLSGNANSNLAVAPNPANTANIVFTSSNTNAGAPVYVSNAATGGSLPLGVGGLTANPVVGATLGHVYGISADKRLVRANPTPAILGAVTGDANWNSGTISSDSFFDNLGRMYIVVTSTGGTKSLYLIDIPTLTATSFLGLSGSLPNAIQGLAYFNNRIYMVEGYTSGFIIQRFNARVYEINPNTGVSVVKTTYELNSGFFNANSDDLDLATCQIFTPTTAPTCNELFGVVTLTHEVYKIDPNSNPANLTTVIVADGDQTTQGNMAYGPIPGNLDQNQFITSRNNTNGNVYHGTAASGFTNLSLYSPNRTWNGPTGTNTSAVGIGTDPSTGIVYGIFGKSLSRFDGTGNNNATVLGDITSADAEWTSASAVVLNDIAVDNGGNLYCMINIGTTNCYLFRVNPTTRVATRVAKVSGVYPDGSDGNAGNGNGLAYLGDFFYYSRSVTATNNTTIWKLNATTGASTLIGTVVGKLIGDLGSCATVTNVPSTFQFDCTLLNPAALQSGQLVANGAAQTNVLVVPIKNAINGLAEFTLTGTGISTTPNPIILFVAQGATSIEIPFTFDGGGGSGVRNVVVTSNIVGSGSCNAALIVAAGNCYDDPYTGGTTEATKHGITTLNRAGSNVATEWPGIRKGAFTALESNNKGFVITRMTTLQLEGQLLPTPIASLITNPIEGMMVYDTTVGCLKIYTVNTLLPLLSGWRCYTAPACP